MILPIDVLLRKRAINYIDMIGLGIKEIVIDIKLSDMEINSIEYCDIKEKVLLHVFDGEMDLTFDFDLMEENDRLIIIDFLRDI